MGLTIDVNYFNSFYLKRIYGDATGAGTAKGIPYAVNQGDRAGRTPTEGGSSNWTTPIVANTTYDWYIEESRIRAGYNNTTVDFGVKAYIVEDNDAQVTRANSLIYSGVFNSKTGINETNEFNIGEEITRTVDPKGGSIQRLFAEDTNLTVFQERKCNVALIDKDAVYTAEGVGITSTGRQVIGQVTPVPGNWGIGTNPESFATYGYTKYFVDRDRNAVLKIAGTQIQEISNAGMMDFFRDQLSLVGSNGALVGSYDVYNQNYVLSIQPNGRFSDTSYKTLTFDERNQGWTSFFTYKPDDMFSCKGQFYSFKGVTSVNKSYLYQHYTNIERNTFYETQSKSSIQFVFNPAPNQVKTFKTLNYEGSNGWEVTSLISDSTGEDPSVTPPGGWLSNYDQISGDVRNADGAASGTDYARIYSYDEGAYTENNIQYRAGFDRKQNKYWAVIPNNTLNPMAGEVIWGNQTMGIKGYFATVTMKTDDTTNNGGLKSLFAVSSEFISK
tara:strand:- start:480 stop:1979 length:1500 start_codon:yes stop_codon:yes gene_type:complete